MDPLIHCFQNGVFWNPGVPQHENKGSAGKSHYSIKNGNLNIVT
jgi:hypothetical protein